MNATQWKVGTRLAMGFGLVLLMMTVLNVIGIVHLTGIGGINTRMIEKDWVKADAANTVNAMTRENARLTMQLFITPDPEGKGRILSQIDVNKALIGTALDTLDKAVYLPQARALLAGVRENRKQYVASFTQVARLLEEQKRDEAAALMSAETVPLLQTLQDRIKELLDLQKQAVEASSLEITQRIDAARLLMLLAGGVAAAIGVGAGVVITRGLSRQLGGEPAYATAIAGRIAQGDLAVDIRTRTGDRDSLLYAMKAMRDNLENLVGRVRGGTETMASASAQIASGNQDLSDRTEQQAGAIEETATSMGKLASAVEANADHAGQASKMVLSASEVAVKSGNVVEQVVVTMDAINESSQRIADIIGVIDDIAFQTNILALNAAVEAARAGEQGRGFAVVAAEVRQLAQRSAGAAKEIKSLIGASVERVRAGALLAGQAGNSMKDVIASVRQVAGIMNDIAAASAEQTTGIRQINQAISQMEQVTQQNAALVEQAAAAAASMQQQAASLAEAAGVFKFGATPATPADGPGRASDLPAVAQRQVVRLVSSAPAPQASLPALPGKRGELDVV